MKAKFGAIVTEGRGKLSGHVFQQGRSGQIIKTKTSPLLRNSTKQQHQRALLSTISSKWKGLSVEQRYMWNEAVVYFKNTNVFGLSVVKSGFNLFLQQSLYVKLAYNTYLTVPSVPVEKKVFTIAAATSYDSLNAIYINLPNTDYAGSNVLVYATPVIPDGVSNYRNYIKSIGVQSVAGSIVNIVDNYIAAFGSQPLAGNVYVELRGVFLSGQTTLLVGKVLTYQP